MREHLLDDGRHVEVLLSAWVLANLFFYIFEIIQKNGATFGWGIGPSSHAFHTARRFS